MLLNADSSGPAGGGVEGEFSDITCVEFDKRSVRWWWWEKKRCNLTT